MQRAGTAEQLTEARELERWLTHDWLPLDTALTSRLTHTLVEAADQEITVKSRDGLHHTPVGERTGSWDRWDPASLPKDACRAAQKALTELRDGRPCTVDENPEARDTARRAVQRPMGTAFGVMENAIDTIERAAKDAKAARRALKRDLTRRNRTRRIPSRNETRLRTLALRAAEKLEAATSGLGPEISQLANPAWTPATRG